MGENLKISSKLSPCHFHPLLLPLSFRMLGKQTICLNHTSTVLVVLPQGLREGGSLPMQWLGVRIRDPREKTDCKMKMRTVEKLEGPVGCDLSW